MTLKGPSRLGANLGSTTFLQRFLALSHTLSPILKVVVFPLIWFFMSWRASSWAACASSRALMSSSSLFSMARRSVLLEMSGSAWGWYPIMSWNGDFPVVECGWMLWMNSAIGMLSAHEDGFSPQYIRKYISISWLTHSVSPSV